MRTIKIPGITNPVMLDQPISNDTPNFSWYEATKGGSRIPESESVTGRIIRIANMVQDVRDEFGQLQINSWYRPRAVNRAVGGASASQHITGGAVDFVPLNASLEEVYQWCDNKWPNEGLARKHSVFIHLDCRGFRARWDYP